MKKVNYLRKTSKKGLRGLVNEKGIAKQGIIITLWICFALILTSCGKNQTEVTNNQSVEGTEVSSVQTQIKTDAVTLPYDTVKETYADRGIIINYPRIAKMSDGPKQEKLNEIIKMEALRIIGAYRDLDNVNIEVNYNITRQDTELLSIGYSGVSYSKGAAYPKNRFYTTNINICEGSKVRLENLVNVDNNFIEKLKQGRISRDKVTFDMLGYTNDRLIEALNTADSNDNHFTYSYFTSDSLGISVPVVHALGDHVEIEIKYQDIMGDINIENDIGKLLLSN